MDMMCRLPLASGLLLALLLACACGEGPNAGGLVACQTTADCPVDLVCVNGECMTGGDGENADGDLSSADGDEDEIIGECSQDAECDPGYVCQDHFCIPLSIADGDAADGDGATDGDKDVPIDQIPCNRDADCGDGAFCNGDETCGEDLFCKPGLSPCDDGVECTVDACDEEANRCQSTPDNALCADGNPCNGAETCDSVEDCQPGSPLDCDDSLPCTDDACEPDQGCTHTENHTRCDDGVECTTDECKIAENGCVHTPLDDSCDDGVTCTTDRCDAVQGCRHSPNNVVCDDGATCTDDSCHAVNDCEHAPHHEQCAAEAYCAPERPGADPATGCAPRPECLTDPECDDGLFCNGVETCVDNLCQPGAAIGCADALACTADGCDEATKDCTHAPVDENCQNDTACDGREICTLEADCQPGPPLDCNDRIDCTEDSCDPAQGCRHQPVDSNCNDKVACTVDTCKPETGCSNRPDNAFCDDLISCTTNTCDAVQGCLFAPSNAACDDGFACTADTCSTQFGCTYQVNNAACNDGVNCTLDLCEVGVGCTNAPDDSLCAPRVCHAQRGCIEPPNCDVSADCNDGNVCNGPETCAAGYCEPGQALNCDDAVPCTVDSCSPQNGCLHTPDHGRCDDADGCTGDYCDPAENCMHQVIRDQDHDFYIDKTCPGGNDCNDGDPAVHPGLQEVCDDGKDNDCNDKTDLQDPICAPCSGTCPTGMACCGGQCVDILSNRTHCGGCDNPCSTACFKGQCLPAGKCADALNNLITGNARYDSRNTCGARNTFTAGGCPVNGTGEDHIYAIKPIAGTPLQVTMYPGGTEIDKETLYFLSDCQNPSSCFASEAGNLNYNEITLADGNGGEIFFAVADFASGDCGYYDIVVEYNPSDSSCRQNALAPVPGPAAGLLALAAWAAILFALARRRVR
ncbi:MAG: hypothetical protein C4523_08100 [Myxococcales bacterium]|nr:MAG: hypothetical protein C4523_08100 [Myxococcales bacterium]